VEDNRNTLASIEVPGGITAFPKHITRRQTDNLPNHVKGIAQFESHPNLQDQVNPETSYYATRQVDDKAFKVAVEFLRNHNKDCWIALSQDLTTGYWHAEAKEIIPRDNRLLGWWNINDSQHPDFLGEGSSQQIIKETQQEEILAGGLHHITTLEGTSPLSPQEPILSQIKEAVAQGISIPLDVTPAAAVLPPVPQRSSGPSISRSGPPNVPITVTAPGGSTLSYVPMSGPQQPIQVAASRGQTITVAVASNGGLKGTPPPPFEGDRNKSHAFLVIFGIFRFANRKNEAMSNPATWVTTALTYMQGNMMEPWKEEQMTKLEACIAGGTADTEEVYWTKFEQAFKDSFTNTNRKQEAFNDLIKLKHGPNRLDIFISKFKQLATAARVQLDDHGTIYHFKQGLKPGLMQVIIASNAYIPANPWTMFQEWEDNTRSCHMKWIHGQEFKKQNDTRRQGLYQVLGIKQRSRGHPNQGCLLRSNGLKVRRAWGIWRCR